MDMHGYLDVFGNELKNEYPIYSTPYMQNSWYHQGYAIVKGDNENYVIKVIKKRQRPTNVEVSE